MQQRDTPYFEGSPKALVCGGQSLALIVRMLAEAGFVGANTVDDADLVVFGGGSDVDPRYYGQAPIPECGRPDIDRDKYEAEIFRQAFENETPMFGICRGAQFLHVMCGGTLWQDVDRHTQTHPIVDVRTGHTLLASSTHHQMMKYNRDMDLIATVPTPQATYMRDQHTVTHPATDGEIEVEACIYHEHGALCIQGHPEYGPSEFLDWSLALLKEFMHEQTHFVPTTLN